MPLETVDLVCGVAVVADQAPGLERIHELLGLEVGALQNRRHGGAHLALALNVASGPDDTKMVRQAFSEVGEVDLFWNHGSYLRRDVVRGNVLRYTLAG